MVENLGRKLILIGILLATSIALIALPTFPLRLGLDLAGGVRLVYRLDIEGAIASGQISAQEDRDQLLEDTIAIIRNRVDPYGVLDPIIRRIGKDRIEIVIPGIAEVKSGSTIANISEGLASLQSDQILLDIVDEAALAAFPGGGGVVSIGSEKIRYEQRVDNQLLELTRGKDNTDVGEYAAGAQLRLVSDDLIKNAIENLGNLRFMTVARGVELRAFDTDVEQERKRLMDWHTANPSRDFAAYNALTPEQGGSPDILHWYPYRQKEGTAFVEPFEREIEPLIVQKAEWDFTGAHLERVFKSQDDIGRAAVGFEMIANAKGPFGKFTKEYKSHRMAILLNNEIATAPTIEDVLPGSGIIRGQFTDQEVDELVRVLRSGSLRIKPILDNEERVLATVGTAATERGKISGLVAVGLIMVFMGLYYRRLGLFAAIGLASSLILLLGAMVAIQATLTLPGIAGIILTIGMAVDANILIFDRIREERELGRKTVQAVKNGFSNALSAIIDSNVTTLLASFILMNVGTGPVRGFAITLAVGVLTSMFAALVIVRVLLHIDLERKGKDAAPYAMGRLFADAKFSVIKYAKFALPASAILITVGVVAFISEPDRNKLGIDFLGGATIKVRTEEAMDINAMRDRVSRLPGDVGNSEVVALPASEQGSGLYTEFRITYKTEPSKQDEGLEATLESEIRTGLADVLQQGPLDASVASVDTGSRANLVLYFEERHSTDDVQSLLEANVGISDLVVSRREGRENVFQASGTIASGIRDSDLSASVETAFKDQKDGTGKAFIFAWPVPEASVIGRQVVGELRDSAIRAILLSLFVTVLYIRVRFAEYSYGLAAVVAIAHDVLFTLGAVAFFVWAPWIDIEINLPMIAAFLTIIGYSINDTIVIFDRIRENIPRMKGTLEEVVDRSINQTFSRTVMTSGTSMATILVVLVFNFGTGSVLEGFAFAIAFGILVGTYSSIFVAAPVFIWLEKRAQRKDSGGEGAKVVSAAAKAAAKA
jgi:SecD/SecF fusion protein